MTWSIEKGNDNAGSNEAIRPLYQNESKSSERLGIYVLENLRIAMIVSAYCMFLLYYLTICFSLTEVIMSKAQLNLMMVILAI